MANTLKGYLLRYLKELRSLPTADLLEGRYQKFRRMGVFTAAENAGPATRPGPDPESNGYIGGATG